MLTIDSNRILVDTPTLAAVLEHGVLVSLVRKSDGRALVNASSESQAPLSLIYARQECVPLGNEPGDMVTCLPINEHCAEVRVESWNGDGVIIVSEDLASGDLVIEPSGYASRPGLRACRWMVPGLSADLELVAPFFQGVRLPLEDELIRNSHWMWPHYWEAGMAILQSPQTAGGFWVHCQDDRYRYKALQVGTAGDSRCLGLDTECYGPMDTNLGTGGLAWRINVYEGDWQTPASQYRDWLERAYHPERTPRPDWLRDLRFAISWCPCDPAILDALAQRLDPKTVLLHVPNWRSDGYDQNYPTFLPSAAGEQFIKQAQSMGFRTMPHFNSVDMDPTHPAYAYLRDFEYRDPETKRLQGWTWADGKIMPMQESNAARLRHQDKNTMVKIHPGLGMWRSILAQNVRAAVERLSLDTVFLDVTLCTWNLHNCLVENMTPSEGMRRLIAHVASLGRGLAVGGEGRNETTMLDQALSQVHLFKSHQHSIGGLERAGGCALNEFLFGRWCRSFGYTALSGQTSDEQTRMQVHTSLGAMPTVTVHTASDLAQPNPTVDQMLRQAAG